MVANNRKSGSSSVDVSIVNVGHVGMRSAIAALVSVMMLVAFTGTGAGAASLVPSLGAASPFAVLGVATGVSAGLSTITGELGLGSSTQAATGTSAPSSSGLLGTGLLSSGTSLAGSVLGSITGETSSTTVTAPAESAAEKAYQAIAAESSTRVLAGDVAHPTVLSPGVYRVTESLEIASHLILNAGGRTSADFVFQIPSDLRTTLGAEVILDAGAQASNVVWQVGGITDFEPDTSFVGTILSDRSISLGSGSRLEGRALSLAGAVNLNNDSITLPLVGAVTPSASAISAEASNAVPTIERATNVGATSPSLGVGVATRAALPLTAVRDGAVPIPTAPSTNSLIAGVGSVTGLSLALPFIPLGDIGVPALAVPVVVLPMIPLASLNLPPSARGTTAPAESSSALSDVPLPFIPLAGIGVPALAVPVVGAPTIPIGAPSLPTASVPDVLLPTGASSAVPAAALPLPLSALALPSSAPTSVAVPGVSAPSTAPASTSTLSNALGAISLPQLVSPLSTPLSAAVPHVTVPALALPSVSAGGPSAPKVSLTTPTSRGANTASPRVKANSSAHSSSSPRANSASGTTSASGSTIPVGAPQTGFGGMAGSGIRLLLALGALLLAVCSGTLAVRSRRIQHG